MVTIVEKIENERICSERAMHVVELVGPAGTGKSTLAQSLIQTCNEIELVNKPSIRNLKNAPFYLYELLSLMPIIIRICLHGNRWLTKREIKWLANLNGWHRLIQQKLNHSNKILLLDQGPVFMMAQLFSLEFDYNDNGKVDNWRRDVYHKWARTLDLVILLNCSNQYLLDRIRSRDKWHFVKSEPDKLIISYLEKERLILGQEIARLKSDEYPPKLIEIDTTQKSVGDVVDNILVTFG